MNPKNIQVNLAELVRLTPLLLSMMFDKKKYFSEFTHSVAFDLVVILLNQI